MKKYLIVALCGLALGCDKKEDEAKIIPIPTVSYNCASPTCGSSLAGTYLALVVMDGAGNPVRFGVTQASCDNSGCTGSPVAPMIYDVSGESMTTTIAEGTYSVSAYIGAPASTPPSLTEDFFKHIMNNSTKVCVSPTATEGALSITESLTSIALTSCFNKP